MPSPTEDQELSEAHDRHWQVTYNVNLGVRYHMLRQQYFNKCHRIIAGLSILASTSAVATLSNNTGIGVFLAAIVAALQSVDLVVDSRGASQNHNDLRQSYINLESELIRDSENGLSSERFYYYQSKIKAIECKEPPIMRTLLELCAQDVNLALRVKKSDSSDALPWYKKC